MSNLDQEENTIARGFFLTGWSGNSPYSFDTISRGETHVSAVCVSVFGNIQPRPLDAIFNRLRNDPTKADGMLQRFQLAVYPEGLPKWQRPTTWLDKEVKERAFAVFQNLRKLELQEDKPTLVFFDDEAQEEYNHWHDRLEDKVRGIELGNFPHFHSHMSKYRSLAPSLALIFHLVRLAHEDFQGWASIPPITLESLHLALDWCEFLEAHARKIYSAELHHEAVAAQQLAARIKDKQVNDGMTVRDMKRKGWSGLTGESLDLALLELEKHNWLKVVTVDPPKQGGRASEVVRLNPALEGFSL